MNNDNFKDKLRNEFKKSTPDILDKIKNDERFMVPEKQKRSTIFDYLKLRSVRYSLVSTFMLVIVAVLFLQGNIDSQVYASTVTLDINPQMQLVLDEDDNVIEVIGLNDDGIEIFNSNIEFKRMSVDEVIEYIVGRLEQKGYIIDTEDNIIMINVDGESEAIRQRVYDKVSEKMKTEIQNRNKLVKFVNTNDYQLTKDERQTILRLSEQYDINPGRLVMIYEIRKLDDSYTIRELGKMKMRDLYRLEQDLKDAENNQRPYNNGNGNKDT